MISNDYLNFFFLGGKYKHYPLFLYSPSADSEYPDISLTFVRPSKFKQAEAIKDSLCKSGKVDYFRDDKNNIHLLSDESTKLLKTSLENISLTRDFFLYPYGLIMAAYKHNRNPVLAEINSPELGSAIFCQIVNSCFNGELPRGMDLFTIGQTAMECLCIEKPACLPLPEYKLMLK